MLSGIDSIPLTSFKERVNMDEMKNNPHESEGEPYVGATAEPGYNSGDSDFAESAESQPQMPVQPQGGYYYNPYGYNTQNAYQPPVQPYANSYTNNNENYAPESVSQMNEEESRKMRESNSKGRKVFLIVLAVVVAVSAIVIPVALSGKINFAQLFQNTETTSEPPTINENAPQLNISNTPVTDGGASNGALTPEQVYAKIAASNVAVMVYKNNNLYTEGTGIVMKEDKAGEYTYILTCAHVISEPGTDMAIQMENGVRHDAEMVGYDLRTDIGVLKIKAFGLKTAEFGNSDSLKVGSTVYAIGNPGGSALFGTFTDGKVSAIGRSITSSIGYDMVCIQHNAAISPGNSGGALVNEFGQVIGINSSKIAATEFEGISFSIPITQAQDVINKIMLYGYVPGRPRLGISYVANDSSEISGIYSMAVQMMDLPSGSLVVYSIDKESDLAKTEVQPGDMITAVNGKKLDTADVLLETIEKSAVGDELELSIFRIENDYSTKEFKVKVKLIEENSRNNQKEEPTTREILR